MLTLCYSASAQQLKEQFLGLIYPHYSKCLRFFQNLQNVLKKNKKFTLFEAQKQDVFKFSGIFYEFFDITQRKISGQFFLENNWFHPKH